MNKAEMEARFREEYEKYIRFIKDKSIDKEVRWSFFNKCIGAVELASDLYLIESQEYGNLYREVHDLFFDTEYSDVEKEDKLPFEDVPEEDTLPFPKVLDKSPEEFIEIPEENVLPFPPKDPEDIADEFFKFPEKKEEPEPVKQENLLQYLLGMGLDPEKYVLLADGVSAINRALDHEAKYPDKDLRDLLEELRRDYINKLRWMEEGWNGIVTNGSLLEIRNWLDDRETWLN